MEAKKVLVPSLRKPLLCFVVDENLHSELVRHGYDWASVRTKGRVTIHITRNIRIEANDGDYLVIHNLSQLPILISKKKTPHVIEAVSDDTELDMEKLIHENLKIALDHMNQIGELTSDSIKKINHCLG